MNIFLRELRANFKSLLIYSLIVILLTIVGFAKYQAYADNPEMLALLDSMPKAMLDAFNMEAFNLTTLTGFYGVMYTYYALILGIAAIMWGSDIINKEERYKTVEFLLVLPVTRSHVVTSKSLAALVHNILLLAITWGTVRLVSRPYHPGVEFLTFLNKSALGLFILQLVFLTVGLFLGVAMKEYRRVGSVAIAVILLTYFFSITSVLNEKLAFFKYLSPFKYFDAGALYRNGHYASLYLALSAPIIVVSMVGAYVAYNRRDLYV